MLKKQNKYEIRMYYLQQDFRVDIEGKLVFYRRWRLKSVIKANTIKQAYEITSYSFKADKQTKLTQRFKYTVRRLK